MEYVDVAVIGTGSVGSMALWQLSTMPGLSVVGIDQYGPAHSHGSFTGESRLFRVAYKEGPLYVPLLLQARQLWLELEQERGRDLLLPVGALSVGPANSVEMQTTLQTISEFDLPHRTFDAAALRRAYPAFAVRDDDCAVLDELGGGIRSERAVMTALELAEAAGATLLRDRVQGIEEAGDGIVVSLDNGALRAGKVIVASGSWTPGLLPGLADLLEVRPLGLTWLIPRDLRLFQPDAFPVFMRDLGPLHFFGAPSLDGYSIKASTSLDWPAIQRPEDRREFTPEELRVIGHWAQTVFPDLNPEPVRSSVHHDAFTHDRVPIIDLDAGGRLVTVAGLSGHGFKMAPALGRMAAELAVSGQSDLHDHAFSIDASAKRKEAGSLKYSSQSH